MKKMDHRLRNALLSLDVEHTMMEHGPESFMNELIVSCAQLIAAISDRSNTPGFSGHQKNYHVCRQIAAVRIKVDQAMMVWSRNNIETFERSMMQEMDHTVRGRRAERPPRSAWPRCTQCDKRVDVTRPHDVIPGNSGPGSKIYTCHRCAD
jgi:inhibitor of KinA sporulation pathway (predicted exonuclease)